MCPASTTRPQLLDTEGEMFERISFKNVFFKDATNLAKTHFFIIFLSAVEVLGCWVRPGEAGG